MGTRAEQETIIRWDDEQQLVEIYSASPVAWRRLAKLGFRVKQETHDREGGVTGRFYEPVALSQFRFGKKRRRTATEAERRLVVERLKAGRTARREGRFLLRGIHKCNRIDNPTEAVKGKVATPS